MAYKYSVGERKFGDIKAQNDAEGDTLIDFDEDFIDLKTAGQSRIKISGSQGNITFNDTFTFPTTDGNTNQVLTTDGNGNLSFQAPATGSGANPPGGSDRQVQFNDNGSFAGNSGILVDENFNLKVSGSLIGKESIGVGMELGGGRSPSDEWVSTTQPQHKFQVIGDINESATFSVDTAADSVGGSYWAFTKTRGTPSAPRGVNTNDEIARIAFFAHTGSSTLKRSALILAQTDSDGDGRLKFYVTKAGDIDNVAIECYNNQVKVQDQMVIGSSGIIPITNGGASIGGSTHRFENIQGNNLVAFESLKLGGTHPIYDKGGFGISINKDTLPIGNYTSGEGLGYISNSSTVENVVFTLMKNNSHFAGIALNGNTTNSDQKLVFFSQYNSAGFEWKNNIPYYGTNGMGNLNTTGTSLMTLGSSGDLEISKGLQTGGQRKIQVDLVSSSPFSVGDNHHCLTVDTRSSRTINLPSPTNDDAGRILIITDISGMAGTNNVTINAASGDYISGNEDYVINTDGGAVTLLCVGASGWNIINKVV
jgi:hypothetical protein